MTVYGALSSEDTRNGAPCVMGRVREIYGIRHPRAVRLSACAIHVDVGQAADSGGAYRSRMGQRSFGFTATVRNRTIQGL